MEKYKISQVAKMFDINRTALIHYDKWGILKPSIRNEKNYRFYTTEDIKKLELIIALKESGLSLSDIKSYLNNEINKTSKEMLIQQKLEIDNKIETLKNQSHVIEKRIEYLSRFDSINTYEGILIEDYPEMTITYEPIGFGPLMNYGAAVNRLKSRLNAYGQLTSKYGICYDISQTNQPENYVKKYVFDYLIDDGEFDYIIHLPKSKYLRTIHKGQEISVENSIKEVLDYAKKENYRVLGQAFYVPLFDYWESVSNEFVGEILIPIK